jgi:RNA-binding protein FUS
MTQYSPDTIYITNLPQTVTERDLAEKFGSIGVIKHDKKLDKKKIWIYQDKATGLPKGDATVTYDDPPTSDAAVQWFNKTEFLGNVIEVQKATVKDRGFNNNRGRGRGGGFGSRGGRGGGGINRDQGPGGEDWTCGS